MENLNEILKSARESKGVNLQDVSKATKIRVSVLDTIEKGEFDRVPGPAYLKGFIKIYSDYLGLDTKKVLTDHSHLFKSGISPYLVTKKKEDEKEAGFEMPSIAFDPRSLVIAGVIAVLAVVVIAGFFVFKISGKSKAVTAEKKTEAVETRADILIPVESVMPAVKKAEPPAKRPAAATALQSPESLEEMTLSVTAKDDVWLRVKADDQLVFEDILRNGDREAWKARREFQVKTGNAGGAGFSLNGMPIGSLGAVGDVKSFTIGHDVLNKLRSRKK